MKTEKKEEEELGSRRRVWRKEKKRQNRSIKKV